MTNVLSQQLLIQKRLTLNQKKALCMLYKLTEGTKEKYQILVVLAQLASHLNPLIILPSYNPYFESRDKTDHAVEDIQPDSSLKTFRTIQVLGPQRFSQPKTAWKIIFY